MGFRINNNIPALISMGNLSKTQQGLQTSIERLSSGLRINRGADDAAGLTISEKLRGQIRGLNRAIMNAQDGISLIQTAEGALNEDASILNRLRELSIQSQADSLTTNDRLEIQKEVDQLVDEVDRISKTTEFNTKKLLDGRAHALVS
ncbi:flagellin, partial [bacterium]|nr:flagellin [bacterium]